MIYYLCENAAVQQVRVLKAGKLFLSMPPNSWMLECAQKIENETLQYAQEFIWPEPEDPLAAIGVDNLSVELVKPDGSIIGPTRLMANIELQEKVKAFAEKERICEQRHNPLINKIFRSKEKQEASRDNEYKKSD